MGDSGAVLLGIRSNQMLVICVTRLSPTSSLCNLMLLLLNLSLSLLSS